MAPKKATNFGIETLAESQRLQKPGDAGLFVFRAVFSADKNSSALLRIATGSESQCFYGTVKAQRALCVEGCIFEKVAAAIGCAATFQGYPRATSKKKRVCVVTYRHSDNGLFENSLPPPSNMTNL